MTFQELEEKRIIYHKKTQKFTTIGIAIFLGLTILSIFTGFIVVFFQLLFFGLIFYIFIAIFSCRQEHAAYYAAYKDYFVRAALEKTFDDLIYHENGILNAPAYNFIRRGDVYRSEDYASGSYHGIHFEQADIHIQDEHRDSDGDTTYVTVFRGRYMIFDFNRNFEDRMQIVSKRFHVARIKRTGKLFHKTERHQVESSTFNKNFKIYGEDGQEVFYILDPAFIDRIEKLYADLHCPLLLGFDQGKIHIAIDNRKDSFEPPRANKPIDEAREIEKITKDIHLITSFVDDLRLHAYTYKK